MFECVLAAATRRQSRMALATPETTSPRACRPVHHHVTPSHPGWERGKQRQTTIVCPSPGSRMGLEVSGLRRTYHNWRARQFCCAHYVFLDPFMIHPNQDDPPHTSKKQSLHGDLAANPRDFIGVITPAGWCHTSCWLWRNYPRGSLSLPAHNAHAALKLLPPPHYCPKKLQDLVQLHQHCSIKNSECRPAALAPVCVCVWRDT
jgi:hypothetical protein